LVDGNLAVRFDNEGREIQCYVVSGGCLIARAIGQLHAIYHHFIPLIILIILIKNDSRCCATSRDFLNTLTTSKDFFRGHRFATSLQQFVATRLNQNKER